MKWNLGRLVLDLFGAAVTAAAIQTTPSAGPEALQERVQSFQIRLHGPVAEVAPLFGPVREKEWSPAWSPHFVRPDGPTQRAGVIFTTTGADGRERIWILTIYDPEHGQVGYVVVSPGLTANEIRIAVVPDRPGDCIATITYKRSALSPAGNAEVAKLTAHWAAEEQVHWERTINSALASPLNR